jgi:Ca2+-binding RTX toxin-like protein
VRRILTILAALAAVTATTAWVASGTIFCFGGLCHGTGGDDTMIGSNLIDDIRSFEGQDALNGFDGADTLRAGSGRDQAAGGRGADTIYGGDGNDDPLLGGCFAPSCTPGTNSYHGGDGDDVIGADNGNAETVNGGPGFDTAFVDGNDNVTQVEKCIVNGVQKGCP